MERAPPRLRRTFLPEDWQVVIWRARAGQLTRPVAPLEVICGVWPPQEEPRFKVGMPPGPKKVVKKARTTMSTDGSWHNLSRGTCPVAPDWP